MAGVLWLGRDHREALPATATIDDASSASTVEAPSTSSVEHRPLQWNDLGAYPLAPRELARMVAASNRYLFVVGGQSPGQHPEGLVDGAYADMATGRWRQLPTLPVRYVNEVVWTGTELAVSGGLNDSEGALALFDPATEQWRILTVPAEAAFAGVRMAVDGDGIILYGDWGRNASNRVALRVDLTTGEQAQLPTSNDLPLLAYDFPLLVHEGRPFVGGHAPFPSVGMLGTLDLVSGQWTVTEMPQNPVGLAVVGSSVYVLMDGNLGPPWVVGRLNADGRLVDPTWDLDNDQATLPAFGSTQRGLAVFGGYPDDSGRVPTSWQFIDVTTGQITTGTAPEGHNSCAVDTAVVWCADHVTGTVVAASAMSLSPA